MAAHSKIVGGSSAKRVMACPGSVALAAKVPSRPSSTYADEGSLLHDVMDQMLRLDIPAEALLGKTFGTATLTEELIDTKIVPAMAMLDELDPDGRMDYVNEISVDFGDFLPGVFGSADLIGRIGTTVYIVDFKFGAGGVAAEESEQLMFYCAAALRTPSLKWVFEDALDVELVIIQPGRPLDRWPTTFKRVLQFEQDLATAVKKSQAPDAPLASGDHCRWCPGKSICPLVNGEVDRALRTQVKALDAKGISESLGKVELLKMWISELESLAHFTLEEGAAIPGYKLVAKRATRKWVDDKLAIAGLVSAGLPLAQCTTTEVVSPAEAERRLKKFDAKLPGDLVTATSSGTTLAPEDDPRAAAVTIGKSLKGALSRIS